jgi:hypothetical protein
MRFFERLFKRASKAPSENAAPRIAALQLAWRTDTTMPVVDWNAAHEQAKEHPETSALRDYWWSAAIGWLDALRDHLGDRYRIEMSNSFAVLSSLEDKPLQLVVASCERYRKHILRSLEGIASSWGHGPHVVLIFDDIDAYYDYVGNYYPDGGTYSMSSGMFIQHGYGHFVFRSSSVSDMEPTIAHELTHCLLAPLRIPAWLNEGTAVNMEHHLTPHYEDPRHKSAKLREAALDRAAFWNAQTIQEFWSGKSFKRPDKGSGLSYDLAKELTRLIARDFGRYRAFMNVAHRKDGGVEAAASTLEFTLGDLAGAVLGDGPWEPDPAAWQEGTERGQFRGSIQGRDRTFAVDRN